MDTSQLVTQFFFIPNFAVGRCKQAASGGLLDVLTPPSHHGMPPLDIVGPVVCAAYLIPVYVCEGNLNELGIPPMLVQNGAGHGAHAMTDQSVLEPHAF